MGKGRLRGNFFHRKSGIFLRREKVNKSIVGSNFNLLKLNFSEIVTILLTTVFVHNI